MKRLFNWLKSLFVAPEKTRTDFTDNLPAPSANTWPSLNNPYVPNPYAPNLSDATDKFLAQKSQQTYEQAMEEFYNKSVDELKKKAFLHKATLLRDEIAKKGKEKEKKTRSIYDEWEVSQDG